METEIESQPLVCYLKSIALTLQSTIHVLICYLAYNNIQYYLIIENHILSLRQLQRSMCERNLSLKTFKASTVGLRIGLTKQNPVLNPFIKKNSNFLTQVLKITKARPLPYIQHKTNNIKTNSSKQRDKQNRPQNIVDLPILKKTHSTKGIRPMQQIMKKKRNQKEQRFQSVKTQSTHDVHQRNIQDLFLKQKNQKKDQQFEYQLKKAIANGKTLAREVCPEKTHSAQLLDCSAIGNNNEDSFFSTVAEEVFLDTLAANPPRPEHKKVYIDMKIRKKFPNDFFKS